MKVHVLTIQSTLDCETTTEVIWVYYCPHKAEERGNEILLDYDKDGSLFTYAIVILETEVE